MHAVSPKLVMPRACAKHYESQVIPWRVVQDADNAQVWVNAQPDGEI